MKQPVPIFAKEYQFVNGEILSMYNDTLNVTGLKGVKLLYAVKRNIAMLKPYAEAFSDKEIIPMSEEFIKYEEERREMNKRFATDAEGRVKTKKEIIGTQVVEAYDVDINTPAYIKEATAINEKYKEVIDARSQDIKDYNAFLTEPFKEDIKIFKVPLSVAPDDERAFNAISYMIEDLSPEQEQVWLDLFPKQ